MNKYSKYSKINKRTFWKAIHKKGRLTCIKKRSFVSEEAAREFLDKNNYSGKPYLCNFCHKWHNTSKE